jgi:NADH dehydrogenase (ubiquinone) flavoprotein 2
MSNTNDEKVFSFNDANLKLINEIFQKYPSDRRQSAMLPILDIAQRQNNGWLSDEALQAVADIISVPKLSVKSIASFYTMYHLEPVGENVIEVCKTLSCKLRGADKIQEVIENHLNIEIGSTTSDNKFTLLPCECLGACVNAPVVKINDDYYEDLESEDIVKIIDEIKNGTNPKIGSYIDRISSEPLDN